MHTFNPMLCCAHAWKASEDPLAKRKFVCARCGARCVRDDKGMIVEYAASGKRPETAEERASE
jgi:hypothetical protein